MSEIVQTMIKFGITKVKLHKLYGIIIAGNNASIQLLEKNNFKKEAHLKEHTFARGKYFDETIYGLIA